MKRLLFTINIMYKDEDDEITVFRGDLRSLEAEPDQSIEQFLSTVRLVGQGFMENMINELESACKK